MLFIPVLVMHHLAHTSKTTSGVITVNFDNTPMGNEL